MLDAEIAKRLSAPTGPLGCKLWSGAVSDRGYPVARVNGRNRQVRRSLYERQRRKLSPDERVEMQCGERLCLVVEHMQVTPRSAS
jgi:hypothetical protein